MSFDDEPDDLALLSDRQLRAAWRSSGERLRQQTDHLGIARVTSQRARYLDELVRRDPDRFSWLVAGASAPEEGGHVLDRFVPHQRRSSEE